MEAAQFESEQGMKGELWLVINQDDAGRIVAWIWEKPGMVVLRRGAARPREPRGVLG
jgi:hypothetical protein